MSVFIALILTIAVFAFIAYPLFRQKPASAEPTGDDKFRELHSRRDTTYSMLKELEFDYQSGILSEEDYKDLEGRYKRKAISILKDTDSLENGGDAHSDEIESEVQKLRRGKNGGGDNLDAEIEQEVARLRSTAGGGRHARSTNSFGSAQDKSEQAHARFCSQCGAALKEGARFCSSCGTRLR